MCCPASSIVMIDILSSSDPKVRPPAQAVFFESLTRCRTRLINEMTSSAEAPPSLTMKFACNGDTTAAPSLSPFNPA